MSYCRWSCMRGQSDLYCYYSVDDVYVTHIASHRNPPIPDDVIDPLEHIYNSDPDDDLDHEEWNAINERWCAAHDKAAEGRFEIESQYAGSTYHDPTLEEFRERIADLSKDPNLIVPPWLLTAIDEEINAQEE